MDKNMQRLVIVGCLLVGLILFSVHRTLKATDKLTAVEALYGIGRFENKKNRYLFIAVITFGIIAAGVFDARRIQLIVSEATI